MHDPREGLDRDGTIRTGADRNRIAPGFVPVLDTAVDRVGALDPDISVYVYGSVATGMARMPDSDLDLLTIGLANDLAARMARELSTEFAGLCRGVEFAAAVSSDLVGEGDEAYGGRVFLHHYCVHVTGPDLDRATSGFPGDDRAARGFNGDVAMHARDWRDRLGTADPAVLGRRVARKSLLAVAGLVSIHDSIWTTDRSTASRRWSQVHPSLASGLAVLLAWADGRAEADRVSLAEQLDATVDVIVRQFDADIGLWSSGRPSSDPPHPA